MTRPSTRWTFAIGSLVMLAVAPLRSADAQQSSGQQENCYPSRFGPKDQIGNLRYVTPAKTLAATKLVTRGKSYRLGIETNKKTPAFPPRTFAITVLQPGQPLGAPMGPTKTTYNDDIITGWVGVGSQLDGLGHLGSTASTTTATGPPSS